MPIEAMGGYNFGSGSGSGASDKLARDKFEYEKRQDAFQRAADLASSKLRVSAREDARVTWVV
jgi:hypothetical protein